MELEYYKKSEHGYSSDYIGNVLSIENYNLLVRILDSKNEFGHIENIILKVDFPRYKFQDYCKAELEKNGKIIKNVRSFKEVTTVVIDDTIDLYFTPYVFSKRTITSENDSLYRENRMGKVIFEELHKVDDISNIKLLNYDKQSPDDRLIVLYKNDSLEYPVLAYELLDIQKDSRYPVKTMRRINFVNLITSTKTLIDKRKFLYLDDLFYHKTNIDIAVNTLFSFNMVNNGYWFFILLYKYKDLILSSKSYQSNRNLQLYNLSLFDKMIDLVNDIKKNRLVFIKILYINYIKNKIDEKNPISLEILEDFKARVYDNASRLILTEYGFDDTFTMSFFIKFPEENLLAKKYGNYNI